MSADKHCYDYERPALTTDAVVLRNGSEVLLIQRINDPYKDTWALPGGFVDKYEIPAVACMRELEEETRLQVSKDDLMLIDVYGEKGRDPRGWTVSVAYLTEFKEKDGNQEVSSGSDSKNVQWFALDTLPELAFDHKKIIADAIGKIYH